MKAYFNELPGLLKKGLAPFYLISGEEPLQRMEATDMIHSAADRAGYHNREFFFVESNFDWNVLRLSSSNVSLFGAKRLLDIRLQTDKIGNAGAAFLKSILDSPHDDCLYLVQADKADGRLTWVKKASKEGVWVQVYQKNIRDMRAWLGERALRVGLTVEDGVINFITQYCEGNMLAAAQEIDKLGLLSKDKSRIIKLRDVEQAITNSAHYTVWSLADSVVIGDADRALRILRSLKLDNAPLPLIIWALADQFRKIAAIQQRIAEGNSAESALRSVWKSRQPVFRKALARKLRPGWWSEMLHGCYQVDKAIKGHGQDESWNELLRIVMRGVGIAPMRKPKTTLMIPVTAP